MERAGGSGHEYARGDDDGELVVLQCACGWRSGRNVDAARAGDAWDAHRREHAPRD